MTEEKKIIKTENIKNLFCWEGFSKEIPWILFIFFILISAYSYKSDIGQCRDMMENSCYQQCRINQYIIDFELKNPGVKANCYKDNITGQYNCEFSGLQNQMLPGYENIKKALDNINNMSLIPKNDNKS